VASITSDDVTLSGSGNTRTFSMPSKSVTVKASFSPIDYTIKYVLNGTEATSFEETSIGLATYNIETATFDLVSLGKDNYTFSGWKTASDLSGESVASIANGSTGDKIFYATMAPTTYTITYVLNGKEVTTISPATYNVESEAFNLEDQGKTGYTFSGWKTASDLSGESVASIANGSTGDKTFYATLTRDEYTIKYVLNGKEVTTINPATYNVESEDFDLEDQSKTGYTFSGWKTASDLSGESVASIAKGSIGDKTFYATLTPITYNVKYVLNGKEVTTINPATYNVESEDFNLEDQSKTGYTFSGWKTASDLSGESVASIAKGTTGNKTFYATLTRDEYTIAYMDNGSEADVKGGLTEYNVETETFKLVGFEARMMRFAGWYKDEAFTDGPVKEIVQGSTGNLILYAKWEDFEPNDDGCYEIYDAGDLFNFAIVVNEKNSEQRDICGKLMENIVVNKNALTDKGFPNTAGGSQREWTPIGTQDNPFHGTFDGQGHSISGLIYTDNADYIGLFGYVSELMEKTASSERTTIGNVGVENSYFRARIQPVNATEC